MIYVAGGVAVIALFLAWRSNRKNAVLKERVAQVNSRVYNMRREFDETLRDVHREVDVLRYDLMLLQGTAHITAEMTVDAIIGTNPQAADILAAFHMGGCSGCAVDGSQRLAVAAAQNNQPLKPILVALNNFIKLNHDAQDTSMPLPNVQLEF